MSDEVEQVYIYVLIDPETEEVRYVGKTKDPTARYQAHISPSCLKAKTHKNNWIKSLLAKDMRPAMRIIEVVPIEAWQEAEKRWIAHYWEEGCKLTNGTEGGESRPETPKPKRAKKAPKKRKNRIWPKGKRRVAHYRRQRRAREARQDEILRKYRERTEGGDSLARSEIRFSRVCIKKNTRERKSYYTYTLDKRQVV